MRLLNVEDLIPYWNNIYDHLFGYGRMIVQRLDASPFTRKEVDTIWTLMVENMSEDGFPLGRRLYNRKRLLEIWMKMECKPFGREAYLQYKRVLGKKALESIFGIASMSAFERHLHGEGR